MSDLLDTYFARVGYTGPRAVTLEVLHALQGLHPAVIAFESLDPFMGRPVPIDPASVRAKLLGERRGGYCYEHNGLFHDVLVELGFDVDPLGARVVWMRPDGKAPLNHRMLLVTTAQGPFIVDVGFGGQTPTSPLRLEPDTSQQTPHGTYRIMLDGSDYTLEMRLPDRWAPLYRFRLDLQNPIDFEMANWFTSTHPGSRFTQNLICARVDGTRRLTLANRAFAVRDTDGGVSTRELTSAVELGAVLDGMFGLDVPVALDTLWARVTTVATGVSSSPMQRAGDANNSNYNNKNPGKFN